MLPRSSKHLLLKILFRIDHVFNRIYSKEYNPIYQSGTLALLFLALASATGVYLIFFYKVSAPYDSVKQITEHVFLGSWVRTIHRLSSDTALVCILFHIIRVSIQKRFNGPRVFVWVTGIFFTSFVFLLAWTGLAMVWDAPGYRLVTSLAKILDLMPIFIEPIELSLVSQITQPRSFFFMLLFLHVSLPLALIFGYWLHTTRLARAAIWPHKKLSYCCIAIVLLASLLWQFPVANPVSIFKQAHILEINWFYGFWIPVTIYGSPVLGLLFLLGIPLMLFLIPYIFDAEKNVPSFVHEKSCTGCTSCYMDCPFEAISMVPRSIGHGSEFVAHVDPKLCVSCGICAAACDPMGVGPHGKTGRDQLKLAEHFFESSLVNLENPIVIACEQTWNPQWNPLIPQKIHLVPCTGNIHSSVIEYFVRRGVRGVVIYSCPERNCFNREGPKFLKARLYDGHDSALKDSIDKRRLKVVSIDLYDTSLVQESYNEFCQELNSMGKHDAEAKVLIDTDCPSEK